MKFNKQKIFVTCVITMMAVLFFILTPRFVGFFIVIPGFSLYLRFWFNLINQNCVTFDKTRKNLFYNGPIGSEVASNPKSYHNRKSRQERAYGRH